MLALAFVRRLLLPNLRELPLTYRWIRDLNDNELAAEVEKRHLRRSRGAKPERILQYFANLELQPGASAEAIEASFARLVERYDPERQSTPEKKASAEALLRSLREAHAGLHHYLKHRRR